MSIVGIGAQPSSGYDSTGNWSGPLINQEQITAFIANGQGYSLSLGNFTSGSSTNNYAISLFNPSANTKNIYVYSVIIANGSGGLTGLLQLITSDTSFTQTNPINSKAGGAASSIQSTSRIATTNQSLSGTFREVIAIASASMEMLPNNDGILLPQGSNNGLVCYIQTYAAGINSAVIKYVEY